MKIEIHTKTEVETEPVDLAEAKNYLKLPSGSTADDDLITELITASRQELEGYTGLGFAPRTIQVYWEGSKKFDLPLPPQYDDTIGQTIYRVYNDDTADELLTENSDYYITGMTYKVADMNDFWSTGTTTVTGYKIEYITGYATLPKALKEALLKTINYNYYNRGDEDLFTGLPNEVKLMVRPYKLNQWV